MITACGILFVAKTTGNILFLQRAKGIHYKYTWEFPGGKLQKNEKHFEGLIREVTEELGFNPKCEHYFCINKYENQTKTFSYLTFCGIVEKEFIPVLNKEHLGYAWCNINFYPHPVHTRIKELLNNKVIKSNLLKFQN